MSDQDAAGRPEWLRAHGQNWTRSAPRLIHDNPYFAVEEYAAVAPTGRAATYWVHRQKNLAVGVIPLHADGSISLVGQWRFPFDAYSWELPEGGVPPGEAAVHGAQRELREEAGLVAATWLPILRVHLSNASSDEVCDIFLATDFTEAPVEPDDTEALTPARVPFGEVLAAILAGDIQDAITVAAVLRLHHMAVTGELAPGLAQAVLHSVRTAPRR